MNASISSGLLFIRAESQRECSRLRDQFGPFEDKPSKRALPPLDKWREVAGDSPAHGHAIYWDGEGTFRFSIQDAWWNYDD